MTTPICPICGAAARSALSRSSQTILYSGCPNSPDDSPYHKLWREKAALEKGIIAVGHNNDALREELADWRDGAKRALDETCGTDQKHCTCVPALRSVAKELRKEVFQFQKGYESLVAEITALRNQLANISEELGLPPTIGPAPGELKRILEAAQKDAAQLKAKDARIAELEKEKAERDRPCVWDPDSGFGGSPGYKTSCGRYEGSFHDRCRCGHPVEVKEEK